MKTQKLSILIPVYNENECIVSFYERLKVVLQKISCAVEILFVNDGSSDNSLALIQELQRQDTRICYVDLSRNYGKEVAMCAGIDYIKGDTLVIMDVDLQNPPEIIPAMLEEIEKGYDDVYGCRVDRKDESWIKRWGARNYYRFLNRFSRVPIQENASDFRMLSLKAITALRNLKENERSMKGLFSYIGFNKKPIYYEPAKRIAGYTKWNYMQLMDLAIKGLTSSSVFPLRCVSLIGALVSVVAFIYFITVLVKASLWGDPVSGYPSLMCVVLFLGGMILLALGIIGEYLSIIFNETKKRPIYYVKEYSWVSDSQE